MVKWGVIAFLSFGISQPLWSAATAPAGEDLFQQALLKESGERNLPGAIELYKQVIALPGAEKLSVFESRLRLGKCYAQLGKIHEAEKVYEQIVKESMASQNALAQDAQATLKNLQTHSRL
jgi:pentatricopeptide repeat protein